MRSLTSNDDIRELPALSIQLNDQAALDGKTPVLDAVLVGTQLAEAGPLENQPLLRQGISLSTDQAENRIDDLTRQVLLKEIELERFSIHYNMEVAKQGRWKGWRYGAFNEANLCMGLAGAIISVNNRGGHIDSPNHVRLAQQESANYIAMIGNIIGAGAAGLEFGINQWHDVEAHKKGFGPRKTRAHVKKIRDEIDAMLAERAQLVNNEASMPALAGRVQLDQVEGKVLKDLLDQNLQQFERFHIGKRRLLAFQQMQLAFDAAKNITSAIGYDYAYKSLALHQRYWNGRAGVMFVISGGLYTVGPVASRLFGWAVGERHRRWLRPTTQTAKNATLEALKADHAQLDSLVKQGNTPPEKVEIAVHRSALYGTREKSFEDEIRRGDKARANAKLIATQTIGAGAYVGCTKIASGILFIIPGYDHRFNRKSKRADRVTNDDLFVSSLISIPATAFAIADTLRINIKGEINRHKLMKMGMHPSQLANARLKELDNLEAQIKATAGP